MEKSKSVALESNVQGAQEQNQKLMPMDISDLEMAFPVSVKKLMPPYEEIPKDFRNWNSHSKWQKLVACWFFSGLKNLKLKPKEGIDEAKALRHIKTILGSFEPKHEHKEAACAYLLSLWFDDATWDENKRVSR